MDEKELNNRRLGALSGMNPYDDAFKSENNSHTGKPRETSNPSIATSNVGVLDENGETFTNEQIAKVDIESLISDSYEEGFKEGRLSAMKEELDNFELHHSEHCGCDRCPSCRIHGKKRKEHLKKQIGEMEKCQ